MNKIKRYAGFLILIAFLVYSYIYFSNNVDDFKRIYHINSYELILIGAVHVGTFLISGVFTKDLLKVFNVDLPLKQYFHLTVVSSFFNSIVPMRAGSGLKAIYLKKKCGLNYSFFLSHMAGTYILIFMVASLLGLSMSLYLYLYKDIIDELSFSAFIVTLSGVALILIVPRSWIDRLKGGVPRAAISVIDGWQKLKSQNNLILRLMFYTFLNLICGTAIMYLALKSINIDCSVSDLLYLSAVNVISSVINITPGGIGVVESMMIFVSRNLSLTTSDILLMSLVSRTVTLFANFLLLPLCSYFLFGDQWKLQLNSLMRKTN